MNKKKFIIIALVLVISLIIAGLYGTFALSSSVTGTDNTYNITLNSNNSEVIVPANSSKTVIYQITNTNKGKVQYGIAYSGTNVTTKVWYDSQDSYSGTIDYGENKFIKLYIINGSSSDSTVSIQAILGYEHGGSLNSLVPSGYNLITKTYRKDGLATSVITNLYDNNYDSSKNITFADGNGVNYYAPTVGLMNDGLDSSGNATNDAYSGNIRYYGTNPNNYIYFNCNDYSNQSSSTCELWRIVGLVDGKIKLVRGSNVGTYTWVTSSSYSYEVGTTYYYSYDMNALYLLNYPYYNNQNITIYYDYAGLYSENITFNTKGIGIKNTDTKNLISPSTWYIGTGTSSYANAVYANEKTSSTKVTNNRIGFLSPSDYGYATDLNYCQSSLANYSDSTCTSYNWIKNILTNNGSRAGWLMNASSTSYVNRYYITSAGGLNYDKSYYQDYWSNTPSYVPSVYLIDEVTFSDVGNGTIDNPYRIKL